MKLRSGEWFVLIGAVSIFALAIVVGKLVLEQPPRVHYMYHDSEVTRQGESVFHREGCGACHKVFGNGYAYGPSLDGVGSRRTQDWLQRYMTAPWPGVSKRRYRTEMPGYDKLPAEDLASLIGYLLALKETNEDGEVLQPRE